MLGLMAAVPVKLEFPQTGILDGGFATELEKRGYDTTGALWSAHALIDAQELIEAVHQSYLEAGADCILTAGYQISEPGFLEAGWSCEDTLRAMHASVEIAVRARDKYTFGTGRRALVAASLGPYGAHLHNGAEYHGNYDCGQPELEEYHRARLAMLEKVQAEEGAAQVDLLAFETVPSLQEASAILHALRGFPEMAAWVSFTCSDEQRVGHGERIEDCAAILDAEKQVVAIGVNCTAPHLVGGLVERIRTMTGKPVLVYPNSGEGWDAEHRCWTGRRDAASFSDMARDWQKRGAGWIGGCCRTGPEHIRSIAQPGNRR